MGEQIQQRVFIPLKESEMLGGIADLLRLVFIEEDRLSLFYPQPYQEYRSGTQLGMSLYTIRGTLYTLDNAVQELKRDNR